jgi:hypothetical protein
MFYYDRQQLETEFGQIRAHAESLLLAILREASGLYAAVTPNRFGDVEDRYARLLHPTFRRHKGAVLGFGLKFWPDDLEVLKTKSPHLAGLSDWIGK